MTRTRRRLTMTRRRKEQAGDEKAEMVDEEDK